MKSMLAIILVSFLSVTPEWLTNMDEAKKIAGENNKLILLNFSGSDWCAPCIKMKKEVFLQDAFLQYAEEHLILVRADFPRLKKNQLEAAQVKHNEALAEQYNPTGKFPYTLLLDANGKLIKAWDGYKTMAPEDFVKELSQASHD